MKTQEEQDIAIERAAHSGFFGKITTYAGLSGPGWIQAAVTLGGGSLVGALYLGVLGGYQFMWLQPLAMLCGIIMLGAISHVTLSGKERPFISVKKHVSPTLAWGWLGATIIADVVFCSAQFALGTDTLQNNLGIAENQPFLITGAFALVTIFLMWLSSRGSRASAVIDNILKCLVAIVVLAFMGVVIKLSIDGAVRWGELFAGLVPDFTALFKPTETYSEAIAATGENASFWSSYIATSQRDVIIGAFGSAVGINMTFLLPYTLQKRGWGPRHRELSRFDLVLGLFIPFILATSFLVIATASQFHARTDAVYSQGAYENVVDALLAQENPDFPNLSEPQQNAAREALPAADQDLGIMLANRDASNLATSLEPFLGRFSQFIFGIGVLAMALSTMIVHMMMNGYAVSEAFGRPGHRHLFLFGAIIPAFTGFLSPILWTGQAKTSLVVPAAVIATTLLPIAYIIFVLLMNSRKALGDALPRRRTLVNILLILATSAAAFASIWNLIGKYQSPNSYAHLFGLVGLIGLPILVLIGIIGFIKRERSS